MNACDPSHPAHLRRTATVARHHDMPLVASALDAAAERVEELECALIEERAACAYWQERAGSFRTALREVGR